MIASEKKTHAPLYQSHGTEKMPKSDKVATTVAKQSGLVLAPSRYRHRLKHGNYSSRLSTTVHVYSAGAMQAVLEEIFAVSADLCVAEKKKKVTQRHINEAIRETPHLAKLFENIDMEGMGVAQHVSPALLSKRKSRRRRKQQRKRE